MTDRYADSAARFNSDTANHEMTVLHDDDLYRHLRFKAPNTGFYWFDLITWPGYLAFTGDMDGYVFTRVEDMFTFFRDGNRYGINPSYWGEKVVDGRDRLKRYDQDILNPQIAAALKEYEENYDHLRVTWEYERSRFDAVPHDLRYPYKADGAREPFEPKPPAELRELVEDYEADGTLSYESGARQLLGELETARIVADTNEWTLTTWDWSFLWTCHAIVWGIAQYDGQRAEAPAVAVVAP